MTEAEARALFHQGEEAVVAFLLDVSRRLQSIEEKIAKNSGNSSLPPSSDGLSKAPLKPMPQSLRRKNGKKRGGQQGHEGATLCMIDMPDQIIAHRPPTCKHCKASLGRKEPVTHSRRQIFEMPVPKVHVTEHRALTVGCPCCGKETTAPFPEGVSQPVQYGPNLLGFATYLHVVHLIPFARCAKIVHEVTSAPFSAGTLYRALGTASRHLDTFMDRLKQSLSEADHLHVDETGTRVEGKLNWFHVRCTETLCYLFRHQRRGKEAVNDLSAYSGRLISDFYGSYVKMSCPHQFCGAHLLRELAFAGDVLKQSWADPLRAVLERMVSACHRAREQGAGQVEDASVLAREFDRWVNEGLHTNLTQRGQVLVKRGDRAKRGRVAKGKALCLLERLRDYRAECLAFLFDLSLPFTNNEAERDLRMFKVKSKISGGFRTAAGADIYCRLRSYMMTCQKQRMGLLNSLQSVFAGSVPMPHFGDA